MKLSLIGYSASGKTTLAERLAGKRVESFDPFHPAVSLARLPDPRLDQLEKLVHPPKATPPEATLVDFKGAARETGFDERVFQQVLETDMALLVVDGFSGSPPENDLTSLCLEFVLRDSERLANLKARRSEEIPSGKRKPNPAEDAAIEKAMAWLEKERPLRTLEIDPPGRTFLDSLGLVTPRRSAVVLNGGEPTDAVLSESRRFSLACVHLDPSADISREDLSRFWRGILSASGLITFYTIGPKELRAWLLPAGSTAVQAAGLIHTDIAHGFIRAEVIPFEDFCRLGSAAACKEKGIMRLEAKEYPVRDGDIIFVRFSR